MWQRCRGGGSATKAAELRNIDVSPACYKKTNSDQTSWSSNTMPEDDDQSTGWQWIGWGGCLHQSSAKVLLPRIWGEYILLATTV